MAVVSVPLNIDVGCDTLVTVTIVSAAGAQMGIVGATGEVDVRITPTDATPLFDITTTPSASGSLSFGVTFPSPAGIAVSNTGGLEALASGATSTTVLPALGVTVASLSALATQATAGFAVGVLAFVQANPGSYFSWSPLDPSTPNGTTVVAGVGGNWLAFGTITISITAQASYALVGYDQAAWAATVTWADGTRSALVNGTAYITQTLS